MTAAALALLLAAAFLGPAQSKPHRNPSLLGESQNQSEPDGSEPQNRSEPETALPRQRGSLSRVCVENRGGFELSFTLWDTVGNRVSERSQPRAHGGRVCIDMDVERHLGHPIVAVVHATGGITRSVRVPLHSRETIVTCSGSSGAFSCGLEGERRTDQPGAHVLAGEPASEPVRAKGICVQNTGAFLLRFRLWDTATGALSAWSGGITAPAGGGTPVCMDGSSIEGVSGGNPLVPIVSPQGTTPGSFRSIVYDPDATTSALFLCAGSNIWYDCKLLGSTRRLQAESEPQGNQSEDESQHESKNQSEPHGSESQNQSEPDGSESQNRSEPETALPSVSWVCIENRAGFVLTFTLWDTVSNRVSEKSFPYTKGGSPCLPIRALGDVEPGHPIVAVVHATGGITRSLRVPPVVHSRDGGKTAYFTCSGSSGAFSCGLEGERRTDQPGAHVLAGQPASEPLRAKGICVQNTGAFLLRFRLWDTATGALSAWSGGITAPAGGGTPVCMDGSSTEGVSGGNPLVPIVSPQGTTPGSFRSVVYDPDATTSALFLCAGSNIWYDCKLLGSTRRL